MAVGNRVFLKRPMPSQELLDGFAGLPAANIADTMGRSCAMNPRIKRMSGFQGIMVGPALTVKARAGDNLFLHQALDTAQPGDIIVADADGIIVIPLKDAPAVLEAAKKFHQQDEAKVEAAKNGTSNRAWVMKTLQAKNTEFIDGAYGE